MKMEKRIEWVDSLKGFAIICVVLGHIADGYINANLFSEYSHILRGIYNFTYMFHMAVFFTLSGFSYRIAYYIRTKDSTELRNPHRYKGQVYNLVLIYVFYCVLTGVFKNILGRFASNPTALSDILWIWAKPISPYWYLYVLIVYYMMFSIKRIRDANKAVLMPIFAIVSMISHYIYTKEWFQVHLILYFVLYFYIGIRLAENKEDILFGRMLTSGLFCISVLFSVLFWNNDKFICRIPIVNTIVGVGITLFLVKVFSSIALLSKHGLLSFLGKHSLEIYVIHCFLTAGNRVLFSRLGIVNIWVSIGLNMVLSISGSLLFAVLVRRIGLYDLFFKPYKLIEKRREGVE